MVLRDPQTINSCLPPLNSCFGVLRSFMQAPRPSAKHWKGFGRVFRHQTLFQGVYGFGMFPNRKLLFLEFLDD